MSEGRESCSIPATIFATTKNEWKWLSKTRGDRLIIAKGCSPPFKGTNGGWNGQRERERRTTLLRLATFFNCRDVFPEKRAAATVPVFKNYPSRLNWRLSAIVAMFFSSSLPNNSPPIWDRLVLAFSRFLLEYPVNSFLLFRFSPSFSAAPFLSRTRNLRDSIIIPRPASFVLEWKEWKPARK